MYAFLLWMSLGCGWLVCRILKYVWSSFITSSGSGGQSSFRSNGSARLDRIAILLPYVPSSREHRPSSSSDSVEGGTFPSYLDVFLTSVAGSSELVDFFLICSDIHRSVIVDVQSRLPQNVKLIDFGLGTDALAKYILERLVHKDDEQINEDVLEHFARHIRMNPYALVEIKPAMGHVFQNFIGDYSHWGYSDLDIMFGDLPRWIDRDEEMQKHDIVTYSFGDQDRLYLRGQLTFMKNIEKINQLWRDCDYLSNMHDRLWRDMEGHERLTFESAEGCFSAVVLRQTDLNVKYAVKALTDVSEARNSAFKTTVYLGTGSNGDRSIVYKTHYLHKEFDTHLLSQVPLNWFEDSKWGYSNYDEIIQRPVGQLIPVERFSDNDQPHCMYWAPQTYQREICVKDVDWYEYNIYLLNGKLFKQKFEMVSIPDIIETAPFYHFQEWKRTYHESQISSIRDRSRYLNGWALVKEGVIPLPNKSKSSERQNLEMSSSNMESLPNKFFCLNSTRKTYPPMSFSTTCTNNASWQDENTVTILKHWKVPSTDMEKEVSLVITLELKPKLTSDEFVRILDVIESNLKVWQGPAIVLIHKLFESNTQDMDYLKTHVRMESSIYARTLVATVVSNNDGPISNKALINMASAACRTRWIVTGVDIERGIILSRETYQFVKRTGTIYDSIYGNVFLIPTFVSKDQLSKDGTIFSPSLLDFEQLQKHLVYQVNQFDQINDGCKVGNDDALHKHLYELWLKFMTMEISNGPLTNELYIEIEAFSSTIVNEILLGYDTDEWQRVLYLMFAPIMMIDRLGPLPGIDTLTVAPEVEEFAGYNCASSLRLAQLAALGYHLRILNGAFAISDPISRAASRGMDYIEGGMSDDKSRRRACEYCTMLTDDDLLYYMLDEEIRRVVKAPLLWDQLS